VAETPGGSSHAHAYARPQAPQSAVTRGQFLTLSTVGLGAMIGAVIGVPATAYILSPVTEESTFKPVQLGKTSDFDSEKGFAPTPRTFIEDPKNANTSSALAWVHYTGKSNQDWTASDAKYIVFSNRCMHLGCPVAATTLGFACPCHGGQYDREGRRIAGPPIRPLDRYQWELRSGGTELWLTNRWSVDFVGTQVKYFPVKMPGQPVDLPGPSWIPDVLYPNVTYNHGPVPNK
jgi:menaquinol-cytochrome c reductase iron-sulfur subunit